MSYSVKKLAQMSGVSVRTLHWYDEIGLLKPAYLGANGYRYYEEEQVLMLQQILFFRELGFELKDIQRVLESSDFDKVRALQTHRRTLGESLDSTRKLIETIDKTILHLRGKYKMKEKEYYAGFDLSKQKDYEQYLVKYHGTVAEDLIAESKKRTAAWEQSTWQEVKDEGNAIYQGVADCMKKGLGPRSDEIQALVQRHYEMIERFYHATKDVYTGLAQLYVEHEGFRKFFEPFDPHLAEVMAEAMRFYAQRKL